MTLSDSLPTAPRSAPAIRPRIGLVIGSGGLKCAASIGLWRALQRAGIPVDVVVGCSGGSVYGAAFVLGYSAADAEAFTMRLWSRSFGRVRLRSLLRLTLPFGFGFTERLGLLDDRAIGRSLGELYGGADFAGTRIPLFITATDLHSTETVVLDRGRIRDAVRASIAMPVVLPPWAVGGRVLIDGGASNPLPIDVAIREGCEIIIAMGFENHSGAVISSFVGLLGQTTLITTNHLLRSTYAFYSVAHHAEIVPVMPSFGQPVRITDVHLVPELIAKGEEATEAQIPYLRHLLTAPRP